MPGFFSFRFFCFLFLFVFSEGNFNTDNYDAVLIIVDVIAMVSDDTISIKSHGLEEQRVCGQNRVFF